MTRQPPTPPPWLPNWRKASGYPSVAADAWRYRWEFLRRRADYQRDYQNAPGPLHIVRFGTPAEKTPAKGKKATPALARKYGLEILLDPATRDVPRSYFAHAPGIVQADLETQRRWAQRGLVLCAVDLSQPIKRQLDDLLPVLAAEQSRRQLTPAGKQVRAKWQFYLRVLDAYALGAALDSILHHLHRVWVNPNDPTDRIESTDLRQGKTIVSRWRRNAAHQQKVMTRP